ncbi:hypothetical protein [uncultured Acinetobacter sp.]|uniref:hypothetical protein n=1 Tax=uncultured Acinetobacter sp. TaxID=165433 RepID=UPI002635061A|nr:hypothetical protein [uncultured Acinetobacter sp.]
MDELVQLNVQPVTYRRFLELQQLLKQSKSDNLAQAVGENLAEIACQVVEQVFGFLSQISANQQQFESEHTVEQIKASIAKHLPWSMQLLNHERLSSLIDDLGQMMSFTDGKIWLKYPISSHLARQLRGYSQHLHSSQEIVQAFGLIVDIIDQGVTQLVRNPKKKLKFNFMVDKSLAGVIGLTTQLGYKRLEKMGKQLNPEQAQAYLQHFLQFIPQKN